MEGVSERVIAVLNQSALDDFDVSCAAMACDLQMRTQVARTWPRLPYAPVRFYTSPRKLPLAHEMLWLLIVSDTIDADGVPGYRDPSVSTVVMAQGSMTAASLSHQALELAADPACNLWVDMPDGRSCALEIADPAEADRYAVEVPVTPEEKRVVLVSSFVTPDWFRAGAPGAFELRAGGSMIVRDPDGRVYDEWQNTDAGVPMRRALKRANSTSRFYRRGVR